MDLPLVPPSPLSLGGGGGGGGGGVGQGPSQSLLLVVPPPVGVVDGPPPPCETEPPPPPVVGPGPPPPPVGLGQSSNEHCARDGRVCTAVKSREHASVSTADRTKLRTMRIIVSVRTTANWDLQMCPHRRPGSLSKARPPPHRSVRKSRTECWISGWWSCRWSAR